MDLITKYNENLPQNAWALKFIKNNNKIHAYLGEKVESFTNGFVEGVWDGVFKDYDFSSASFQLGSSVKLFDEFLHIYTPGHVLERIYIYICCVQHKC